MSHFCAEAFKTLRMFDIKTPMYVSGVVQDDFSTLLQKLDPERQYRLYIDGPPIEVSLAECKEKLRLKRGAVFCVVEKIPAVKSLSIRIDIAKDSLVQVTCTHMQTRNVEKIYGKTLRDFQIEEICDVFQIESSFRLNLSLTVRNLIRAFEALCLDALVVDEIVCRNDGVWLVESVHLFHKENAKKHSLELVCKGFGKIGIIANGKNLALSVVDMLQKRFVSPLFVFSIGDEVDWDLLQEAVKKSLEKKVTEFLIVVSTCRQLDINRIDSLSQQVAAVPVVLCIQGCAGQLVKEYSNVTIFTDVLECFKKYDKG